VVLQLEQGTVAHQTLGYHIGCQIYICTNLKRSLENATVFFFLRFLCFLREESKSDSSISAASKAAHQTLVYCIGYQI
jgi:hypothetical protein